MAVELDDDVPGVVAVDELPDPIVFVVELKFISLIFPYAHKKKAQTYRVLVYSFRSLL